MSHITEIPNLILLNIGYSEPNSDWNWQNVHSPFARIYYVKEGNAKTYIKGKEYPLKPNHIYLTPPFTEHDDECNSVFHLYYIHFYENVTGKESIFDRFDFPIELAATDLDLSLTKRLHHINPERHLRYIDPKVYDNPPTFSQYIADNNNMPAHLIMETQGILYQLLSRFLELAIVKSEKIDSRINKTLQFIHENINTEIAVSHLASLACISEDHFTRLFKKTIGLAPIKYINLKKIEKAQLLLLTTDNMIGDIAMELAVENISYFNRMFRQHAGMTPGEYREKYNK